MKLKRLAYWLLLATIWSLPIEEQVTLPVIGTISKILGLAAFVAWGIAGLVRGTMREPSAFHKAMFGLAVWVGLSLFWSADPTASGGRFITYLQLLFLTLMIWDLCVTDRQIRAAMQALVLGLWVNAANGYLNFARGIEAEFGRFSSTGSDANEAALLLAIGIPFALYLALDSPKSVLRTINFAYVPVGAVAIALSGSRTALVAGVAVVVYAVLATRRIHRFGIVVLVVLVGVSLWAITTVVPSEVIDRSLQVGTNVSEGDFGERAIIWGEAREAFESRPLAGVGAGATRAVLPTGKVAHNVVITIGVELGLVGLLLFFTIGTNLVLAVIGMRPGERQMWIAVLCTWTIGSLTLAIDTRKYTWLLFALVVAAAASRPWDTERDQPFVPFVSRWTHRVAHGVAQM
ncbi:MAG: O-antigen ligase family protein [Acidimicrobiales bacterium]